MLAMSDPTGGVRVEGFTLGPFSTNCYVVHAPPDRECWIVDASFSPSPMIERVRRLGLRPSLVILTHAHVDHIAGLDEVRRAFASPPEGQGGGPLVAIHEAEAGFLEEPMLNLSGQYGVPFSTGGPDRALRGGQRLELGGTRWNVLHTPGHSPGGITLFWEGGSEDEGGEAAPAAIVGDTLFAGSIGRADFPTSDEAALHRSIREVLYRLPDRTRVYSGHGPATTIGREKKSNPFVREG